MHHTVTLIAAALLAASAAAQTTPPPVPPSPFRYMLITDGTQVWPADTLATDASVNAATNSVATVEATLDSQQQAVEDIGSRLAALEDTVADLGQDGVWVLEGYINSIGVLSGMPEYDGDIEIVHLTADRNPDGTTQLTLYAAFDPAPSTASQVAMVGTVALGTDFGDVTYVTSYPQTVANPRDPADTRAVYTFSAPIGTTAGFAKIISLPGSQVGVGDYLPVTGGISVNGINGADATVTADDGTVLTFKGGILVDPDPVTTLSDGGDL